MLPKKLLYILLFLVFTAQNAAAQCAMCRAALASGDDTSQAEGVNNGIVYLMVLPYILVGIVGYAVYRLKNSKKA